MASDITLAVGGGSRRMTYAELADMRRISVASAERLVRRRGWERISGNDGVVRISVPLDEARKKPTRTNRLSVSGQRTSPPDIDVVRTLEKSVSVLSAQLDIANQQSAADRTRADRLHGELVEARAAERKAIDLVRYATAEASDQRKRADDAVDAERIARDEAAGLRAELDARRQWSLWRRVKGR